MCEQQPEERGSEPCGCWGKGFRHRGQRTQRPRNPKVIGVSEERPRGQCGVRREVGKRADALGSCAAALGKR